MFSVLMQPWDAEDNVIGMFCWHPTLPYDLNRVIFAENCFAMLAVAIVVSAVFSIFSLTRFGRKISPKYLTLQPRNFTVTVKNLAAMKSVLWDRL